MITSYLLSALTSPTCWSQPPWGRSDLPRGILALCRRRRWCCLRSSTLETCGPLQPREKHHIHQLFTSHRRRLLKLRNSVNNKTPNWMCNWSGGSMNTRPRVCVCVCLYLWTLQWVGCCCRWRPVSWWGSRCPVWRRSLPPHSSEEFAVNSWSSETRRRKSNSRWLPAATGIWHVCPSKKKTNKTYR